MDDIRQILKSLPFNFAQAVILNLTLVAIIYFLFYKIFKNRFRNWRIQIKEKIDTKQIRTELKNGFFTLLVGASFSSIVIFLSTKGYTKIYTHFTDHSPIIGVVGFFILLIIDDTWFYWCHRMLHHPKFFRYVHVVHHRSTDVNPFTSISFHWLEPFLLTFWIFPVAVLMPVYAPVLGIVQLWGLFENIKSHLGYELYPANFNKTWLKFLTSSTHHNMHHRKFRGNYGVHFRIWDRLLNTEFDDYEEEYDAIQKRKKNASRFQKNKKG